MINKGRKLKRFLGLKRAKPNYYGGIDLISPSMMKGWVVSEKNIIDKIARVALILDKDNKIIAELNEYRTDIAEIYKTESYTGFTINFPIAKPSNISPRNIRIVGLNEKGKTILEIPFFNKSINSKKTLCDLFNSNIYGTQGNIDGYHPDGNIFGWASKINSKDTVDIWIQAKGETSIKINCDICRYELLALNVKENSGFRIEISDLPKDWHGEKVFFSFDREGKFKIPQNEDIYIPEFNITNNMLDNFELMNNIEKNINFDMDLLPKEIQSYLKKIKNISDDLYEYESKLVKFDYIKKYSKKGFWQKVINIFRTR